MHALILSDFFRIVAVVFRLRGETALRYRFTPANIMMMMAWNITLNLDLQE